MTSSRRRPALGTAVLLQVPGGDAGGEAPGLGAAHGDGEHGLHRLDDGLEVFASNVLAKLLDGSGVAVEAFEAQGLAEAADRRDDLPGRPGPPGLGVRIFHAPEVLHEAEELLLG
mmetsp:Transcript_7273/g.18955  ORF Transcript_7273/g.18955 Transcript_7273/m.18955 type:complete len:115 (-) Transcript_7273:270-614(-)